MCPYLGSGNPLYAGFYECDLTGRASLCGGDVAHCESPQAREKEKELWPIVIVEPDPEDLIQHGRQEWLEICDYTKHVQG